MELLIGTRSRPSRRVQASALYGKPGSVTVVELLQDNQPKAAADKGFDHQGGGSPSPVVSVV